MEEELGFGGQSLAKLFPVNYSALLGRKTKLRGGEGSVMC